MNTTIMTYEEFEWHILRLVYEDGLDCLQPSYLAYALSLPHDTVSNYLEKATQNSLLEMEVNADGHIEYKIPGVDRDKQLPAPLWKSNEKPAGATTHPENQTTNPPTDHPHPSLQSQPSGDPRARTFTVPAPQILQPQTPAQPNYNDHLPYGLRAHVEKRVPGVDGHPNSSLQSPVLSTNATLASPVIGYNAHIDQTVTALQRYGENMPFRVEATNESFSDPSQTVFMRQLRVYGVQDEAVLRNHVQKMFESFGYKMVKSEHQRVRFERGSVTFILALVPLFVLVVPLFIYLFLYCMGRSTIHQEPVELDVQFRRHDGPEPYFDIDLTFIGLHGVVLGTADQRVLNQEIDTLREELRWSFHAG